METGTASSTLMPFRQYGHVGSFLPRIQWSMHSLHTTALQHADLHTVGPSQVVHFSIGELSDVRFW